MSYTALAISGVFLTVITDLFILRSRLLLTKRYWASYAIVVFFQLITNWWLTSRGIVQYSDDAILGPRIASAPIEDLLFGFTLVTLVLIRWDRAKD
jgi:lycopene cyclase domain-containing protein